LKIQPRNWRTLGGLFELETKETRIAELDEMMLDPHFWDDQQGAQKVINEANGLKELVNVYHDLIESQENLELTYELIKEENDPELQQELEAELHEFEKLNEYQHVDSAGKFLNNMQDGWCVGPEDTREFVSNYKFQICFENSSCKGYTTEKLIGAWAAGVVPIYWGDPSVTEVFNPEAFVWVKDTTEEELDKAFQQVKYLNENEKAYTNMLAQPILKDMGNPPEYFAKDYLERYLLEIIDLPLDKALERTNAKDGWGAFYETDYLRHREMDQSKLISLIYRIRRRLKK